MKTQKPRPHPEPADALYRRALAGRARVFQFTGQYPRALKDWRRFKKTSHEPRSDYEYYQGVSDLHDHTGRFNRAVELREKAIAICRCFPGTLNESALLVAQVQLLLRKNEYAAAFNKARGLLKAGGNLNKHNKARVYTLMGTSSMHMGKYVPALACFSRARSLHRQINNLEGMTIVDNNLTLTYWKMGKYKNAIKHCRQALGVREKIGHVFGISTALNNLGLIYDEMGNYREALECYEKALAMFRRLNDRYGITIALTNIGTIYSDIYGDIEKAFEYHRQSLELVRRTGDKYGEFEGLLMMADMHWRQKDRKAFSRTVDAMGRLVNTLQSREMHIVYLLNRVKSCAWNNWHSLDRAILKLFAALKRTPDDMLIVDSIAGLVGVIETFGLNKWLEPVQPWVKKMENKLPAIESPLRRVKTLRGLIKFYLMRGNRTRAENFFKQWQKTYQHYGIKSEEKVLLRFGDGALKKL